jgi:hypothetical protein
MPGDASTLSLYQVRGFARRAPAGGVGAAAVGDPERRLFVLLRKYASSVGPSVYMLYARRRLGPEHVLVPADSIFTMPHWLPFLDQADGLHRAPYHPARGPFTAAEVADWLAAAKGVSSSSDDLLWAAALRL